MGCDIHLVLERRRRGVWIGLDTFQRAWTSTDWHGATRARNYRRFAALAGVRGDGPGPRGLPQDLSDLARMEIDDWAGEGHTHSWLPLREAAAVWLATEHLPSDYASNHPEWFFFRAESEDIEEYRVVFWFDN